MGSNVTPSRNKTDETPRVAIFPVASAKTSQPAPRTEDFCQFRNFEVNSGSKIAAAVFCV